MDNVCCLFRENNFLEYQSFDKNFSLFTKIKTLCKTATSLSKTKKKSFLNLKFYPPLAESNIHSSSASATSDTENRLIRDLHSFKDENKLLKRKVDCLYKLQEFSTDNSNKVCKLEKANQKLRDMQEKT